MKIGIRVDSSSAMGSGHLMRCVLLGRYFREQGDEVFFLSRELPLHQIEQIEADQFRVFRLKAPTGSPAGDLTLFEQWLGVLCEEDAREVAEILAGLQGIDWLVLDNYALDARWERVIRPFVNKIMVIDDLADRVHDCDLILDQNFYDCYDNLYAGLVPPHCEKLLGPDYLLLRKEFLSLGDKPVCRDVRNLLITMGGSDPLNLTQWALDLIAGQVAIPLEITVVIGPGYAWEDGIRRCARDFSNELHKITVLRNISNMHEIMHGVDIAITAGGSTVYELVFVGIPSIVVAANETQVESSAFLHRRGALEYIGLYRDGLDRRLLDKLELLISDLDFRRRLSSSSKSLIDGNGIRRIYTRMKSILYGVA